MTHITTRDLQDYYTPLQCRSRISLLDRLGAIAFSKLVWFDNEDDKPRGSTLRHISVSKGIDALQDYLATYQHNPHVMIQKSLSTKRELLDVLKILKEK